MNLERQQDVRHALAAATASRDALRALWQRDGDPKLMELLVAASKLVAAIETYQEGR